LSRPFFPRGNSPSSGSFVRVNGKIRAREVRVIGAEGQQLGIISLSDALVMARNLQVDLVEIAANATPPVCRLVDFGKYRYEQSKKEKDVKKHQHANKVKEIQLSPGIDPHDFGVKLTHAINFLCDEMKVKVTLRFRGRELAHKEFGFQQIEKFVKEIAPFGHPDAPPKLIGKGINVMISPLPRNKRAKNPHADAPETSSPQSSESSEKKQNSAPSAARKSVSTSEAAPVDSGETLSDFGQNPFANLNIETPSDA
jgi:translation initiation factor IF-3